MSDLFANGDQKTSYNAKEIEVLEGLEPVRHRPGMYIGGTDERALHHLAAEILDNSMDEAVAGHASWIEIYLENNNTLSIRDNGRGILIDPHPKFPDKSALEVILTTLHAGGKFSGEGLSDLWRTSWGWSICGECVIQPSWRLRLPAKKLCINSHFRRGKPTGQLSVVGRTVNRRGTLIRFTPDEDIFGANCRFKPETLISHGPVQGLSLCWS